MLKLIAVAAASALAGAAISLVFAASLFAHGQQVSAVHAGQSVDVAALMAQSRDLPEMVIADPL